MMRQEWKRKSLNYFKTVVVSSPVQIWGGVLIALDLWCLCKTDASGSPPMCRPVVPWWPSVSLPPLI